MKIDIGRSYELAGKPKDTIRILVDRLWPRGVKKEALDLDGWAKELSPSDALRKWYGHDPEKWENFKARYFKELDRNSKEVAGFLDSIRHHKHITLVYSSTEREINNATALKEYLTERLK
jgi:uncharacterized protein YeaO (DUF488 family)